MEIMRSCIIGSVLDPEILDLDPKNQSNAVTFVSRHGKIDVHMQFIAVKITDHLYEHKTDNIFKRY